MSERLGDTGTLNKAQIDFGRTYTAADLAAALGAMREACRNVCDEHAEELIAMIGKTGVEQTDRRCKDQAYTSRICGQRIGELTDPTPAEAAKWLADRDADIKQEQVDYYEAILAMTVARLEGTVDGYPTARINFLQRIDQLVNKENEATKREAAIRKQERERCGEIILGLSLMPLYLRQSILRNIGVELTTPPSKESE